VNNSRNRPIIYYLVLSISRFISVMGLLVFARRIQ